MAGTLEIAGMAILGSTIPWSISRIGDTPTLLTSVASWVPEDIEAGYVIRADGTDVSYPSYWTAYAPGRKELAAGAGDLGLAKCVKACDKHFQQLQASAAHSPQR